MIDSKVRVIVNEGGRIVARYGTVLEVEGASVIVEIGFLGPQYRVPMTATKVLCR